MVQQKRTGLLLVEDEAIIVFAERRMLENAGYTVIHVPTGEAAVECIRGNAPVDLVLMDIDLGVGLAGLEAAQQILALRDVPIVFLTGHAEDHIVQQLRRVTRYGYVIKGSGDSVLRGAIEVALDLFSDHRRTRNDLARKSAVIDAIPDNIYVISETGRLVECLGPDRSLRHGPDALGPELVDTLVEDALNAEDGRRYRELHIRCMETGRVQRMEYRVASAGEEHLFDARLNRLGAAQLLLTTREVTDDDQRERALPAIGEHLEALLDAVPEVVNQGYRPDGTDVYRNNAAERRLLRKLVFQQLISETSREFMRISGDDFGPAITRALQRMGCYFGSDRCYVVEFDSERRQMSELYEWTAPGIPSVKDQIQQTPTDRFQWIADQLLAGRPVYIPRVSDLPPEAQEERERFLERGVFSMAAVPLVGADRTVGYIGLHAAQEPADWDRTEIEDARVVGELIAQVLERRRAALEQQEYQRRIEVYARDQEVLLREMHHRVKNTITMIRSLISLQSDRISDPAAKTAVRDLRSRIMGMFSVYKHLDRSSGLRSVSVPEYLRELLDGISSGFVIQPGLRLHGDFAPARVDSRTVFPLGLLVNELVTNALKYGFPATTEGARARAATDPCILVSLKPYGTDWWDVAVVDNGVGLPPGFDPDASRGIGMALVQALADQVEGTFTIGSGPGGVGTRATLRFPRRVTAADHQPRSTVAGR